MPNLILDYGNPKRTTELLDAFAEALEGKLVHAPDFIMGLLTLTADAIKGAKPELQTRLAKDAHAALDLMLKEFRGPHFTESVGGHVKH